MEELRAIRAQLRALYHKAMLAGDEAAALEAGKAMVAIDEILLN